jgi:chlorobactene glucosyltransferase
MISFGIIAYLPVPLVHRTRWPWLATANGQCMVFGRDAYRAIGGHGAVKGEVLEDILLAQAVKRAGMRLRLADGAEFLRCRMYRDWETVRDGFAKNVLATYGNSVFLLGMMGLVHWVLYVWPWAWLAFGLVGSRQQGWPEMPLTMLFLGLGIRCIEAWVTRQRVCDAVWMPLSVIVVTRIGLQSMWWYWRYGGPRWKGRVLARAKSLNRQLAE